MPTVTSRIPQTEQYRRTRDAWADSQMGRLNKELGSALSSADFREANRVRSMRRAWEKKEGITPASAYETGTIPRITWKTGRGRTVTGKPPLETAGIEKALDLVTDPFMVQVLRESDIQAAEAATVIFNAWPAWSGRSKSALPLAWGNGSVGTEIRFICGADYVFRASPTARAWANARRVWAMVPAKIGENLRARKV